MTMTSEGEAARTGHHRCGPLAGGAAAAAAAALPDHRIGHRALGPGDAEPQPSLLRPRFRRGEQVRGHRGAAVVHRRRRGRPRGDAGRPGPRAGEPHALRRGRVVVLRSADPARRSPPARHHVVRLPSHRDPVRRSHHVQPGRHHLHQPARGARRQAALDRHPLPRRRSACAAAPSARARPSRCGSTKTCWPTTSASAPTTGSCTPTAIWRRSFDTVEKGEQLPERVIGPHSVASFTTEHRARPATVWGAAYYTEGPTGPVGRRLDQRDGP